MPRIGFLFESDVSLADVSTLDVENDDTELSFRGRINSTGAPQTEVTEVSLYIEWGTDKNEVLDQDASFNAAAPSTTTEDNQEFQFIITADPEQTYYYRAVAINEAGRVNGALYKAVPAHLDD